MEKVCSNTQSAKGIDSPGMGLSIIPTSTEKIPYKGWKDFQSVMAPASMWHTHYINGNYVGIICGKISGNLECIDIDTKNDPKGTIKDEYFNLIPKDLLDRLIIQTTVNKGHHLIYRCPDTTIESSLKLALHDNKAVIIETRGEGGIFCTSKSGYAIIQGTLDLANHDADIPVITPQERELLLTVARSLTRYFPKPNESSKKGQYAYKEPAINNFNADYNILELFDKHGWSVVKEDDNKIFFLREGSLAPHSGYYFKDTKTFFCFSTSTDFDTEKPYNHFQVLQVLEGKNDYKTTLRLLPDLGFALSAEPQRGQVTSDDIAWYLNEQGVRYDTFIQDLTINGKIIDELDYNTLYIDLKKHFEQGIPRTRFEEIIKSHYIMTVNRITQFIEQHSDRKPEGTFEKWMECIELSNPRIDARAILYMLKKWYVSLIAQALDGEFPNEFFLCLLSTEQGIGKTTLLRKYILPETLHNYRKEHSLCFSDDFKVHMGQTVLIIDDEMDGRTWETDKTFKTVLSTKELLTRRKYDRRMSTIKRRCSFAGSGNNLAVVREKQNRRIIPIEIKKVYYDKIATIDLTDLFMEAYNLFDAGFRYSFQRDDKYVLGQLFDDYIVPSDVDLVLDEQITKATSENDVWFITNLDLVNTLSYLYPNFSRRINVATIGKLLSERGIQSTRKGKKRISCYPISSTSRIWVDIDKNSVSYRLNNPDEAFITGGGETLRLF